MNLLIFLDFIHNPRKNFDFTFFDQGQNVQLFLIFIYNQDKMFLTLPITGGGGQCIPGLHWELPSPLGKQSQNSIGSVGVRTFLGTAPLKKLQKYVHTLWNPHGKFDPKWVYNWGKINVLN